MKLKTGKFFKKFGQVKVVNLDVGLLFRFVTIFQILFGNEVFIKGEHQWFSDKAYHFKSNSWAITSQILYIITVGYCLLMVALLVSFWVKPEKSEISENKET